MDVQSLIIVVTAVNTTVNIVANAALTIGMEYIKRRYPSRSVPPSPESSTHHDHAHQNQNQLVRPGLYQDTLPDELRPKDARGRDRHRR